jgi:hypothetical protein
MGAKIRRPVWKIRQIKADKDQKRWEKVGEELDALESKRTPHL